MMSQSSVSQPDVMAIASIAPVPMAARAGMSREGFSRKFARDHGMPPHAFWLMARLNFARTLLRAGEGIAEVAAKSGFTDQSHLGRSKRQRDAGQ
jgi:AraC-like DNA-binding protein